MRLDTLEYMTPPFESDIRAQLVGVLGEALGQAPDAKRIRLPARVAHASVRLPEGVDASTLATPDFGSLYGAPLVETLRVVSGWLLFDFSPRFFSALTQAILAADPAPDTAGNQPETHAENRMRALSRHPGSGCPDHPAFHRALILALVAHESDAAYQRAQMAAETLFHTIPPRDRGALFSRCGALGGALWRLLYKSR